MGKTFICGVALAAVLCLCPQAGAETFHLNGGGEIDCQSYRYENGRFYVRINRETVVDFSRDEAAPSMLMKAEAPVRKDRERREQARPPRPEAASGAAKPAVIGRRASPENVAGQGGDPEMRKQLVALYDRFHQAALAGAFEEQLKWVTAKRQEKMKSAMENIPDGKKAEMKELMKGMTARGYTVTGMQVSSGGRRATLTLEGRIAFMGKDSLSDGAVDFVMEGGEWKIDKVEWDSRG